MLRDKRELQPKRLARGNHEIIKKLAYFCIIILAIIGIAILFSKSINPVSAAAPVIEDIQPNNGPIAGGTVITVTGSGFKGEYERVEALIFDGASYIDTDIPVRNKDVNARFFINTSDTTTINMVFGTNGTASADRLGFGRNTGTGSTYTTYRGTGTTTVGSQFISTSTNNDITIDANGVYHINGSQMATVGALPTATAMLRIGGSAAPEAYYRGRLISISTYANASLEHNFMPVRRVSDGAYGMIDMTTRQFYGNSGTGTISGGSTVEDVFVENAIIPGALSPDEQTRVLIDGRDCTGVAIASDTELTCHTPSGESLGQKDVIVSTASGDYTVTNGFEYALRLNAITPKFGAPTGGNTIEIDGGVFSTPPEQYVSVEGIVFDGISWIETGFNQLGDIKMSVTFINDLPTTPVRNVGFFGARTASSTESFVVWQGVNSATMRTDYGGASSVTTPLTSMQKPNIYRIEKDNGKTTVYRESDGATIWNPAAGAKQNFTTPVNMLLGSLRHGAAYGTNGSTAYGSFQGTIYSAYICKDVSNASAVPAGTVYQTDDERCGTTRKLVRDFRPGYRETDGAYGFYDMVTGEFIENAGFGRFHPSGQTIENELEVPLALDVQVGGQTCTNPQLLSPVKISCTVPASNLPANGLGKVDVSVTANGVLATPGTSDADDYYYGAPMVVNSITPNRGSLAGGQVVTIHGSNFLPVLEETDFDPQQDWDKITITIGGEPCTLQQQSDFSIDTIICTTSAHTGGISDVFVDNTETTYLYGGSIDPITGAITSGYLYEDDLISVSPTSGPSTGGTLVTIRGNNFLTSGTTTQVFLSGAPATNVTVVNSTTITARTPPHAPGLVDILVSQNGYAASLDRTVQGAYEYYFTGSSGALSPNRGYISGGDIITITGSGFDPNTTADVTFGGVPATNVLVVNATTIRLTTPAHAKGLVDIVITQYGVDSTIENAFTFIDPLTITSVNPGQGSTEGGTVVTILGESFVPIEGTPTSTLADLEVTFGNVPCNVLSVADYTDVLIRCTTTAHAEGLVDVTITTGNGPNYTNTLSGGFSYILLSLSLSTEQVDISASRTSIDTGSVQVSVFSGSTSGYNLFIQANDQNSSTNNDNWLKCTTPGSTYRYTTLATAGNLAENTWGFNIGNTAPTTWRPIPAITTTLMPAITHPSGPEEDGTEADMYQLWYGVKTGYTQPACAYTSQIMLTLVSSQ